MCAAVFGSEGESLSNVVEAPARTPIGTFIAYAAGGLSLSGLGTAMAIAVQPYLAEDLGVGLIPIGFAFFLVRMLDLGVDPVLAILMDRSRTPLGRYRVWSLAGIPILMLGVWQIFMAHKGIGVTYLVIWLLVYALGNSTVGLARAAWSANLVTRYAQRSFFYGFLGFALVFGTAVILLTPILSKFLGPHRPNDVQLMGWIILTMLPVGGVITAVFVPERISPDAPKRNLVGATGQHFSFRDYWHLVKKPELLRLFFSQFALTLGPGWMSNLYLFFFINARGFSSSNAYLLLLIYIAAGVAGAPVIGFLGAKFSKHRTMIAATIGYSLGLCTVVIAPKADMAVAIPIMIWCGFTGNGFDLMTSAMMADVGDQVRLEQGKERMALIFAVTGLASKLAAAAAVGISYTLLAVVGYVPTLGVHNTPAAMNGLTWVFITGPIFWVILGGLCIVGWKLTAEKHAEIRAELDARDALMAHMAIQEAGILSP
jgi:Na+/melibiose symporter-like transporter